MKIDYPSGARAIIPFFLLLLIGNVSCETKQGQDPKADSQPVITSVSVSPERPTVRSDLSLTLQSKDPAGNPVRYRYQWIRGNDEIAGENRNTMGSGKFRKGDLVQVRVTPSSEKTEGKPFLSAAVKVLNSLPVIHAVWLEPKTIYVTDNLKAHVKADDADRDFIYYSYQWEKNGAVLPDEKSEVLEQGKFKKGDSIRVTVTPDDRENNGAARKSDPALISNSPPVIISSPPAFTEGETYLYQVKAEDPDGDPLLLTLKSGPRGMAIDKKTGLTRWEIRKEDKGNHPVEIEVSDDEGGKCFQRYTVSVESR